MSTTNEEIMQIVRLVEDGDYDAVFYEFPSGNIYDSGGHKVVSEYVETLRPRHKVIVVRFLDEPGNVQFRHNGPNIKNREAT